MIRKAFVMQVNPDAHEEYQRRHNPIWYGTGSSAEISRCA
ncbi:L-rhamnose mutarotase [Escherichia coli]|nr:L-rhamnose mutarotase [Escherichia coli]